MFNKVINQHFINGYK